MTSRVARLVLLLLVLGIAGCDQASKHWAEGELSGKPPSTLVAHRLDLEYAQNHGSAFSLDRVLPAGARTPVLWIAGFGLLALLGVALWRQRSELSMRTAGYALVIGGAAGNLVDRLARGYVVDFVHLHGWPIFNVADCAIVAGAGLLVISSRSRPTSSPSTPPPAG
jgi:signal peptidase II